MLQIYLKLINPVYFQISTFYYKAKVKNRFLNFFILKGLFTNFQFTPNKLLNIDVKYYVVNIRTTLGFIAIIKLVLNLVIREDFFQIC